jgi:ribosomal protein S8
MIMSLLDTSQECGYIRGYRSSSVTPSGLSVPPSTKNVSTFTQRIEILLKYKNQKPAINQIVRISKPSRRVYLSVTKLSRMSYGTSSPVSNKLNGKTANCSCYARISAPSDHNPFLFMKGIRIPSTNKGIMSHLTAYRLNIGGEVICHVN